MSVDPYILRPAAAESEAQQQVGFEHHLSEGAFEYFNAVEQSKLAFTGYSQLEQHITSRYAYTRCDHNRQGRGNCPHEDEWHIVDKPIYYNNLICDFSRTRLEVAEQPDDAAWPCDCHQLLAEPHAPRRWLAKLEPLSIASFQHAACQWRAGTKQAGTQSYSRSFNSQRGLHHLHLFQLGDAEALDEEELEEESDSEVYDPEERSDEDYELHPRERQREQVDLDSMLAPPAAHADYLFVSQYAAILFL